MHLCAIVLCDLEIFAGCVYFNYLKLPLANPFFFFNLGIRKEIGLEREERRRRRREEKEKKVTTPGIEPMAAAPSKPARLDVSRSDHSAGSKESAS